MPIADVDAMLFNGMGQRLHWFPADVSPSRLASVLVGMANARGGTVVLGVAPRSPQVLGVPDCPATFDTVFQAALFADPPLVLPMPYSVAAGGAQVVVVQVPDGLPNVYNFEGRYLGREGAQTNPLSARQLRRLLMERGVLQFELETPPNATLDDLDQQKMAEYVYSLNALGDEPVEQVLLRRGCLRFAPKATDEPGKTARSFQDISEADRSRLRPTYAALLLFGKYQEQWLPNANILAARFAGQSAADSFVKQEISGTLPEQLRQAEAFVRDHMRSVVHMIGLTHQETSEYSMEAVRELLVNAVAHRDYNLQGDNIHVFMYADRLEIHSPGGLPGPVTLDNLLEARFSRNAVIMQVLADMGFVERLGYGLNRVVEMMRQNNLRLPQFDEQAGTFRVTLYGAVDQGISESSRTILQSFQGLDLNERQKLALNYLIYNRRITNREYQDLCRDVHSETLRRDLADLVERGVLIKIGDKRATYYVLKST